MLNLKLICLWCFYFCHSAKDFSRFKKNSFVPFQLVQHKIHTGTQCVLERFWQVQLNLGTTSCRLWTSKMRNSIFFSFNNWIHSVHNRLSHQHIWMEIFSERWPNTILPINWPLNLNSLLYFYFFLYFPVRSHGIFHYYFVIESVFFLSFVYLSVL